MASCSFCNSFGATKIQFNYDLATAHANTHFLQMKIIDDGIDLNQIFGQCFPDFAPVGGGAGAGDSGRQQLIALCHTLFPRKSSTPHVICEKCGDEIKAFHGGSSKNSTLLNPNLLIEHACRHMELKLYECRHCVQEFRCRHTLSRHIATVHQLRTSIGHFRSKIDDYFGEISSMIKACFGGKKGAALSKRVSIRSACTTAVRRRTKGSHLSVERQLFCYRLIRKMSDRYGNVQCRLCSKGIRATDGKTVQCARIRGHAYRHLPTPLFRCRFCSEAKFGYADIRAHLQAIHVLPALEQNYECLADQYHSDILAVMNKCYGGNENDSADEVSVRSLSESKIRRQNGRSKLTVRRHLLCHQLIRKRVNVEGMVECRLCSRQINVKCRNTFTSTPVMQHACLHLGKRIYQCKKCSETYRCAPALHCHLKKKHAVPMSQTNYQCLADQFHGDIEIILRQCYGEDDEAENTQISFKREMKDCASAFPSILTMERRSLCARLTRECSAHEGLQCRLCNKRIGGKRANDVSSNNSMQHALVHLDKPIYKCKTCSDTSITRSNFAHHARSKHDLPSKNYEYLGDQFHAEIVEMLHKCYNKEPASELIAPLKRRTSAEASIRRSVNGSKHAVERQLFCYRLIRKFTNSERKIECRLCKKQIVAICGGKYKTAPVMIHTVAHLRKPIYRCTVCSEKCPHYISITRHLKKAHALPLLNNYECLADEYHSEILTKLSECYGEL